MLTGRKSCLSAKAKIGNKTLDFLIDTGASVSIISDKSLKTLNIEQSELSLDTSNIKSVDGKDLKVLGKLWLEFCLGPIMFKHDFLVVELGETTGVLGIDFLDYHNAVVKVSEGSMVIGKKKINLNRDNLVGGDKVKLIKRVVIPAESEMLVKARVQNKYAFTKS